MILGLLREGSRARRRKRQGSAPAASASSSPPLHVRAPSLGFDEVPRRWYANSVGATQLSNGVNLLFPAGERFFVRSVRHYLPELERLAALADEARRAELEALLVQVRGFFGQEGRHAQAHERFFDALRAQGYDVDAVLAAYERVAYGVIEKHAPFALRLSVTVALEHFTAILAEDALDGDALVGAHPSMRKLLEWHAVEEVEHKSVAFDVLRAVRPGYLLRMAGLALGATVLAAFWVQATRALLAQDGLSFREGMRDLKALERRVAAEGRAPRSLARGVFLRGIREYVRPGFHPGGVDHGPTVARALERLTRDGVIQGAAGPRAPTA